MTQTRPLVKFVSLSQWMKELCVREESDVKRLLRCLNIFVGNVATTLIKCRFAPDNVKHLLLETRHVIADTRLQM